MKTSIELKREATQRLHDLKVQYDNMNLLEQKRFRLERPKDFERISRLESTDSDRRLFGRFTYLPYWQVKKGLYGYEQLA